LIPPLALLTRIELLLVLAPPDEMDTAVPVKPMFPVTCTPPLKLLTTIDPGSFDPLAVT